MKREAPHVEIVRADSLQYHPENPNRHVNADLVAESLRVHGQYKPLVVQRSTRTVLVGNGLLEQLRQAGVEDVEVRWVDVDDDQARRILLVDNRTSDFRLYDDTLLADLLESISDNLEGSGFSSEEISDLRRVVDGHLDLSELQPTDLVTDEDFWPLVRVRVCPEDYQTWLALVRSFDGDESAFFGELLRAFQ